jgi:hypothetical protein
LNWRPATDAERAAWPDDPLHVVLFVSDDGRYRVGRVPGRQGWEARAADGTYITGAPSMRGCTQACIRHAKVAGRTR